MQGRTTDYEGHIIRLIGRHGSITASELGDTLRREYGIDYTPSELGKRIRCSKRLRGLVERRKHIYWESRGQFPRTDSIYSLRDGI